MNQELLILQFQQQDVQAYEKLYNAYCKSISGVINTIVKDVEVTEEITQDVFVKVYQSINTFKSNSSLKTWIYRITINQSLDFIKQKTINPMVQRYLQ